MQILIYNIILIWRLILRYHGTDIEYIQVNNIKVEDELPQLPINGVIPKIIHTLFEYQDLPEMEQLMKIMMEFMEEAQLSLVINLLDNQNRIEIIELMK